MIEKSESKTYDFSYPEFYPTNHTLWLPTLTSNSNKNNNSPFLTLFSNFSSFFNKYVPMRALHVLEVYRCI